MKQLILLIANIFLFKIFFGQFSLPIKQDANDASKRILVVELREIPPKELKKLKKKDKGQAIIKSIYDYNKFVKKYIPKYWKLNDQIIFRKTSEVYEIMEQKDNKYLVLVSGPRTELRPSAKVIDEFDTYTFFLFMPEHNKKWDYRYYVDIKSGNMVKKKKYLFKLSFPSSELNENDIKLMCNIFKNNIEKAKDVGKEKGAWRGMYYIPKIGTESDKLKTDTLLLVESSCNFEKNISELYKYPYKVVTVKEQEKIISENKKGYAFLTYLWDDRSKAFVYFVVASEDNKILQKVGKGKINLTIGSKTFEEFIPIYTYRSKLGFSDKSLKALNNLIAKEK